MRAAFTQNLKIALSKSGRVVEKLGGSMCTVDPPCQERSVLKERYVLIQLNAPVPIRFILNLLWLAVKLNNSRVTI